MNRGRLALVLLGAALATLAAAYMLENGSSRGLLGRIGIVPPEK